MPFWVKRNENLEKLPETTLEYFGAADEVYAVNSQKDEAISLTCTHQGSTVKMAADG